jgi:hypothetical protein
LEFLLAFVLAAMFLFAPTLALDAFEFEAFELDAFELDMFAFEGAAFEFAGAALEFAGLLELALLALLAAGSVPPQAIIPPITRVSEMAVSVFFIDSPPGRPFITARSSISYGGLVR